MSTYTPKSKAYRASPLTEFREASVSQHLNGPNFITFTKDQKFDATSCINLQKDVSVTYSNQTLLTGKSKEEVRNLSTGQESISYVIQGANLEEAYTTELSEYEEPGWILDEKGVVLWSAGFVDLQNRMNYYVDGSIISALTVPTYQETYFRSGGICHTTRILGSIYAGNQLVFSNEGTPGSQFVIEKNTYANNYDCSNGAGSAASLSVYGYMYGPNALVIGTNFAVNAIYKRRSHPSVRPRPVINGDWYKAQAHPDDIYEGDTHLSGEIKPKNGVTYIKNGHALFWGETSFTGCIITDSGYDIKLGVLGNFSIYHTKFQNFPAFISGGQLDFNGIRRININGLCYSEGPFFAKPLYDSQIRGGVISGANIILYGYTTSLKLFTLIYENLDRVPYLTYPV